MNDPPSALHLVCAQAIAVPCTDPALCLHTVVANDTLAKIAAAAGSSVQEVQAANGNLDPTKLLIGQASLQCFALGGRVWISLRVIKDLKEGCRFSDHFPPDHSPARLPRCRDQHANHTHQGPNEGRCHSALLLPRMQNIWVRCPCKYEIQSGDTLNKIGAKFGTTGADVLARNPGIDPSKIFIGQASFWQQRCLWESQVVIVLAVKGSCQC